MISDLQDSHLSISKVCSKLGVSASGYYDWKNREPYVNIVDVALRSEIHAIAAEFPKYGYRRMTKELHRRKVRVNSKKIRRLMREERILVKRKKFNPVTTQSNHGFPKHDNMAKGFVPTRINQLFVADITYIRLLYGFVYLAVIIDLYSRRVVGWDLSHEVDTTLTLNALNRAIVLRGKQNLKGCIHHSDQGVQYASRAYVKRLEELSIESQHGRKRTLL